MAHFLTSYDLNVSDETQVGLPESANPFRDDPAKQERFELFLKDKYQGGLRSTYAGNSNMSEVDRARERLDFEAAAEAIVQGESTETPVHQLSIASGGKFVSGGVEVKAVGLSFTTRSSAFLLFAYFLASFCCMMPFFS